MEFFYGPFQVIFFGHFWLKMVSFMEMSHFTNSKFHRVTELVRPNHLGITCTNPKPNFLYYPPLEVYQIHIRVMFAFIWFAIFQVITFFLNY